MCDTLHRMEDFTKEEVQWKGKAKSRDDNPQIQTIPVFLPFFVRF